MKYLPRKAINNMAEGKGNLSGIDYGEGYGSEFDEQEAAERNKTWRDDALFGVKRKEEAKSQKYDFIALDAYSRHKKMINDYVLYYGKGVEHFKRDSSRDKRDLDVIKDEHRFIWHEEDNPESTWEKRLAKKYYDKLFKEYCISDLSRYKENKVALRWRVEKEVIEGKGQFICGDKRCTETEGLRSWEVNFAYVEHEEKKNTLIKLRLCPDCSYKLNYHHKKKLAKQKKKEKKTTSKKSHSSKKKRKQEKNQRNRDKNSSDSSEDSEGDDVKSDAAASGSSQGVDHSKSTSSGEDIWKGPAKITVDKTREEEFEEYFQDMFL
ncbi:hypothetical protein ACROYT_G006029 [Oculina patagonica]